MRNIFRFVLVLRQERERRGKVIRATGAKTHRQGKRH
jgi:hypothetical protein